MSKLQAHFPNKKPSLQQSVEKEQLIFDEINRLKEKNLISSDLIIYFYECTSNKHYYKEKRAYQAQSITKINLN